MNNLTLEQILNFLSSVDPSPFFILSLFPYLIFLYFAKRSSAIPKLSLWGFRLTLLFVLVTIILAIFADQIYSAELTKIDYLHGAAESFLTISDLFIVVGFAKLLKNDKVMKNL